MADTKYNEWRKVAGTKRKVRTRKWEDGTEYVPKEGVTPVGVQKTATEGLSEKEKLRRKIAARIKAEQEKK